MPKAKQSYPPKAGKDKTVYMRTTTQEQLDELSGELDMSNSRVISEAVNTFYHQIFLPPEAVADDEVVVKVEVFEPEKPEPQRYP